MILKGNGYGNDNLVLSESEPVQQIHGGRQRCRSYKCEDCRIICEKGKEGRFGGEYKG